jgi:hypothetical protein
MPRARRHYTCMRYYQWSRTSRPCRRSSPRVFTLPWAFCQRPRVMSELPRSPRLSASPKIIALRKLASQFQESKYINYDFFVFLKCETKFNFYPCFKLSYFQDDIFPETIDKQTAYLTANDWFSGRQFTLNYINLQPSGLEKCNRNFGKF